jgi:uncharacterized membrane protein
MSAPLVGLAVLFMLRSVDMTDPTVILTSRVCYGVIQALILGIYAYIYSCAGGNKSTDVVIYEEMK